MEKGYIPLLDEYLGGVNGDALLLYKMGQS